VESATGSNANLVRELSGLEFGQSSQVKEVLGERLVQFHDQDMWRLAFLGKLLAARGGDYRQMVETRETTELLDSLCIN